MGCPANPNTSENCRKIYFATNRVRLPSISALGYPELNGNFRIIAKGNSFLDQAITLQIKNTLVYSGPSAPYKTLDFSLSNLDAVTEVIPKSYFTNDPNCPMAFSIVEIINGDIANPDTSNTCSTPNFEDDECRTLHFDVSKTLAAPKSLVKTFKIIAEVPATPCFQASL